MMADQCEAFMGYTGDVHSRKVSAAAGFCDTAHPHLVAYFHRSLSTQRQAELIQAAHEVGAF